MFGDGDDGSIRVYHFENQSATEAGTSFIRYDPVKRRKRSNEKGKRTHEGKSLFLGPHGHSEEVDALLFSKDGEKLFSGSRDFTIKIWNVEAKIDGKEVRRVTCDRQLYLSYHIAPLHHCTILGPRELVCRQNAGRA